MPLIPIDPVARRRIENTWPLWSGRGVPIRLWWINPLVLGVMLGLIGWGESGDVFLVLLGIGGGVVVLLPARFYRYRKWLLKAAQSSDT